jgi:hypothetical protein
MPTVERRCYAALLYIIGRRRADVGELPPRRWLNRCEGPTAPVDPSTGVDLACPCGGTEQFFYG